MRGAVFQERRYVNQRRRIDTVLQCGGSRPCCGRLVVACSNLLLLLLRMNQSRLPSLCTSLLQHLIFPRGFCFEVHREIRFELKRRNEEKRVFAKSFAAVEERTVKPVMMGSKSGDGAELTIDDTQRGCDESQSMR